MQSNATEKRSVVVIGAGLAGLYAARLLKAYVGDVLVVEAQNHVGGRVRQVNGYAPWPIEAGPEFVHGSKSKFTEVVADMGFDFEEKPWPDWWYFGSEGRLVNEKDNDDQELERLHELFDSVGDEVPPPPGAPDVSAEAWLLSRGASARMLALADSCYANDFGCSLRQLGLREMILENQRWDSGETYLIMQQPLSALVQRLASGLEVRTSWPVSSINYQQQATPSGGCSGAVLTGPGGTTVHARAVIITAPLRVLQTGRIQFSPALPVPKADAFARLRMGNAVKIICAFDRRFWPADMYDVVCSDCFVPEFWMTRHAPLETLDSMGASSGSNGIGTADVSQLHAVTGFIAGERADAVGHMAPAEAVRRFLEQLDTIFGNSAEPKPASASYVRSHVFDWSKEPWVGGAYSYPSLGAEVGDREALAAPTAGVLFWAGEATHPAINPCMQAALETGERAAAQVRVALQAPPSRL